MSSSPVTNTTQQRFRRRKPSKWGNSKMNRRPYKQNKQPRRIKPPKPKPPINSKENFPSLTTTTTRHKPKKQQPLDFKALIELEKSRSNEDLFITEITKPVYLTKHVIKYERTPSNVNDSDFVTISPVNQDSLFEEWQDQVIEQWTDYDDFAFDIEHDYMHDDEKYFYYFNEWGSDTFSSDQVDENESESDDEDWSSEEDEIL